MRRNLKTAIAGVATGAAALATSVAAQDAQEVWTYWGSGAELAAIEALIEHANQSHPETPVTHRVITGNNTELRRALQLAFLGGESPAAYQSGMAQDLKGFADADRLAAIPDVWEDVNGDDIFPGGLQRTVKVDGVPYGIPLNMAITSNVFYNKEIFDELNLTPPTTWEEFEEVANTLKEAGYQPLAHAAGRAWSLYNLYAPLISKIGIDGYYELASGEMPIDSPEIREAFEIYTDVFVENYMDDWSGYNWIEAADQFVQGDIGMYMVGDWASAHFQQRGWEPGVDYGFFPAPGMEDAVVVQVDVLALPASESEASITAGKNFLRSSASAEAQAAFNDHKGSVAANLNTPAEVYDAIAAQEAEQIQAANEKDAVLPNLYFLLPIEMSQEFGTAIEAYANSPSPEALDSMLADIEQMRQEMQDGGMFVDW